MNNIRDILSQHEVTPSGDVWQKVSHRLDVLLPQSAGSPASPMSGGTSKGMAMLSKGKLAAAVAGLGIGAATVAIIGVALWRSTTPSEPGHSPTSPIIKETADSMIADLPEETSIITADPTRRTSETGTIMALPTVNQPDTKVTENIETIVAPESTSAPATRPVATPQPLVPATITRPNMPSITQPQITISAANDPVVQEHPDFVQESSKPVKLTIPNIFTPNGDGYNDLFVIKGLDQYAHRELLVYDRNGRVVFRSNNYDNNWDGTDCRDGVYFYQLTFGQDAIKETTRGSLEIRR